MIIIRHFSKIFDIIGQIMAFLTVILLGLLYLNSGIIKFIPADTLAVLTTIKEYAVLGTLVVVGFGFASRRNFIFFGIFCLLAVVTIGFSFPALF